MQLTLNEFTTGYGIAIAGFRSTQAKAWAEQTYKVERGYNVLKAKLAFLYCYALGTWEHDDDAINYLDEEMTSAIINKASEL